MPSIPHRHAKGRYDHDSLCHGKIISNGEIDPNLVPVGREALQG